jgi:hypothetical protein
MLAALVADVTDKPVWFLFAATVTLAAVTALRRAAQPSSVHWPRGAPKSGALDLRFF